MKTLIAALAVGMLLGATAAQAGVIHQRQVRQTCRIDQGVRSGALTRAETRILRAQQRHIARAHDRALADGDMSTREARRIAHEQNRASRNIDRLQHNTWPR